MSITFKSEIPPKLQESSSTQNFIEVLDGLKADKEFIIAEQETFLNPILNSNYEALRLLFKECSGLLDIPNIPKICYENFILNSRNIFALKGSEDGLKLFVKSIALGDIQLRGLPYPNRFIILSDINNGYLPNGSDFGLYSADPLVKTNLLWLYGGDNTQYASSVDIMVWSPLFTNEVFREWFVSILQPFLPITDPLTSDISIYMYGHSYIGFPYVYATNL